MRFLQLAGFLIVLIAAVQTKSLVRRTIDDDYYEDDDDNDDSNEYIDGIWFEDDDGNIIEADLTSDDEEETVEETRQDLANRVFFHLYTQEDPTTDEDLYVDDTETLGSSKWNVSKPTWFVTHGWVNSKKSDACVLIRDAILKSGDYNVIVVDWAKIAKRPYTFAQRRVKIIGEWVAAMINFLEKQGMDLSETTIVGHSLGAHIAGLSALQATNTVGYVVGLDPALPMFYTSKSGSRIAKGDAAYVQIIHTNAGRLGYSSAIGDVDFYPNGGSSQKGCYGDVTGGCAHARAYKYYAESLNSETGFWGSVCKSWRRYRWGRCSSNDKAIMAGSSPTTTASGSYYMYTSRRSPYAKGA